MSELNKKLLQGFVDSPPITPEEAAELVRIAEAVENWHQVSKALCGKENATLEELLHVASQVKAKLALAVLQRDAAVRDISRACEFCKHHETSFNGATPDHDCKNPECYNISGVNTGWQWRGVCAENTEVQEDDH